MPPAPAPRPLLPRLPDGDTLSSSQAEVVDDALAGLLPLLDQLRAGPLARHGRASHEVKDDGTPVTPTDLAVDEAIVALVADRFPDHGVVSEELDAVAGDARWQWVVDPVDGTSNFAAGLPHWCVAVALCHDGVPVAGVVDAPALDARWVAVHGRGATRDGTPVTTRVLASLHDPEHAHLPLLSTLGTLARANFRGGLRLNPRVLGATAVEHALVADGVAAAAMALAPKVWDIAAAAVLVREAGGSTLTFGDRGPLFPLRAGTDYAAVAAPAFSAPSPALARELVERTTPPDGWPARVLAQDG